MADVAEQLERLLDAGNGSRVVAGQQLHAAQVVEGVGLAAPVGLAGEQFQGLPVAGGGGVAVGQLVRETDPVEGIALARTVAELTVQGQGLLECGGGLLIDCGLTDEGV